MYDVPQFNFPSSILFSIYRGCTTEGLIVCTAAQEISQFYGQPTFLLTFGIVHLDCFEVKMMHRKTNN